jgi:phenylpropionate dioxygenase-like ring-hydroxylating dioxygenase large terminal subunit
MHGNSEETSRAHVADLRKVGLSPNFWYPLALAKDLVRGKSLAVTFAGDPIVLVRTKQGTVYALEDRCAHRQVPLSRGVVVGECLRCSYHAWTYDEQGNCKVPNLPRGADPPRGVRAYPSREAYGLIFVFPGERCLVDAAAFPEFPESRSRKFMTVTFRRLVNCHYSFMHENLMDMSHQFLHRRWMGRFNPQPFDFRKGSTYVEVDYTVDLTTGGIFLRSVPSILLSLQRSTAETGRRREQAAGSGTLFENDFATITTQYPYQIFQVRRSGLDEPLLKLWLAYVPVGRDQKINRPTGLLMVRKPRVSGLLYGFLPLFAFVLNKIFREDRLALEAEQRAYDLQGGDWNQELFPFILDLRKLLFACGVYEDPK